MEIEIKRVVKDRKRNSAPGPLGISNPLVKDLVPFMTKIMRDYGNNLLFGDAPTYLPMTSPPKCPYSVLEPYLTFSMIHVVKE